MASYSYWIAAAAAVLFVLELFLGTVYLLVLSLALLGAAVAAGLFGVNAAMGVASVLSLLGCVWVRQRQLQQQKTAVSDNLDFDVGQTVYLAQQLPNGDWQVQYRGTLWLAKKPLSGSLKAGQTATIVGRDGNYLIIQ